MKKIIRNTFAAVTLVAGMMGSAHAAEYKTIDPSASSLSFVYSQMNVNMDGKFTELTASTFSFDPAAPEQASVLIEIPVSSIDAGYGEANEELKKSDWLAPSDHPLAKFESAKVQALGDNKFQVDGKLTIKGNTRDVSVPFTFSEKDGKGIFEGTFTFQRADFGVGEGMWADFGIVANEIQIKFSIAANQ